MELEKYLVFLLILSAFMIFIGIHLSVSKIPSKLIKSSIHISMRVIGITLIISPMFSILFYFLHLYEMPAYFTTALTLTSLYLTSIGLTIGMLILMGEKISIKSPLTITILSSVVTYPAFVWGGLSFNKEEYTNFVITTAHAIFFAVAVLEITYIAHRYNSVKQKIDEFYADDNLKVQIKWIGQSAYLFIILLIISVIAVHFLNNSWIPSFVLACYTFATSLHIYAGYNRMLINIMDIYINEPKAKIQEIMPILLNTQEKEFDTKTNINPETKSQLETRITEWLDKKEFIKKNLNIQIVASDIFTNRTYLSNYINHTYNCSFKVWITELRIQEAKKILASEKDLTMAQIAEQAGFSSATSFTHVFAKNEKITPKKWREKHEKQA